MKASSLSRVKYILLHLSYVNSKTVKHDLKIKDEKSRESFGYLDNLQEDRQSDRPKKAIFSLKFMMKLHLVFPQNSSASFFLLGESATENWKPFFFIQTDSPSILLNQGLCLFAISCVPCVDQKKYTKSHLIVA